MNQISPRVFEAIRLRTALILFEGEYSGVLVPWRHYLPLKKNYENLDEILAKLEDIDFLRTLTAQAYDEIVLTGQYSYATFVRSVDAVIREKALSKACCQIYSAPAFAVSSRNAMPIMRNASSDVLISNEIIARAERAKLVTAAARGKLGELPDGIDLKILLRDGIPPSGIVENLKENVPYLSPAGVARRVWRALPAGFRFYVGSRQWARFGVARRVWHFLPGHLRTRIASAVFGR